MPARYGRVRLRGYVGACDAVPDSRDATAQPPGRGRTTIRRFGSSPMDCVATFG